jgi:hypothetical protein
VSALELHTEQGGTWFTPGSTVACQASWHLDQDIDKLELRLFWYTEGKGTQDVVVVDRRVIERPEVHGNYGFRFRLPAGPYSFSGTLITLRWAVELVALPGEETARVDLLLSPSPVEISIQALREC